MVSLRLLTSSDVPSCRNMEKDVTLQHQINNRSNIMNKAELVKSTDGTIEREISILSQIELIRVPYQLFGMSEQLMYRKRIKQNY